MKTVQYSKKTHHYLDENTFEYKKIKICGLLNTKKNVLVEFSRNFGQAHYEYVTDLPTVYYFAKQNGKYGLIDRTGKIIFPFEYEKPITIINGLAIVVKNKQYGAIDLSGKVIIPFEYKYLSFLNEARLVAKIESGKFVIINCQNERICNFEFDDFDITFLNEYAAACINEKWGFVNPTNGNIVIDFVYHDASSFIEGQAPVMNKDGKWGTIDYDNNLIVDFLYDDEYDLPFYQHERDV